MNVSVAVGSAFESWPVDLFYSEKSPKTSKNREEKLLNIYRTFPICYFKKDMITECGLDCRLLDHRLTSSNRTTMLRRGGRLSVVGRGVCWGGGYNIFESWGGEVAS